VIQTLYAHKENSYPLANDTEKHFTDDFSFGRLNKMSELGSIQRKPIHQLFLDCLSYLLSKNYEIIEITKN